MVEPDDNVLISSEESQTVFEGQQMLMQPPPVEMEKKLKQKKTFLIGVAVVGVLMVLMVAGMYLSNSGNPTQLPNGNQVQASPTPIFTDQAKEAELQRVEAIVSGVNPESLLIPPPQVDMLVIF